ncbi:hypothetical protein [Pseudoalteromonas rhizosphaerae]|uniref:hypothetical protein n=1 Tax=Pseudoalteromonas rhizosphaerae TaxID=2518973 RepID=UPI0012316A9A|nr:hypothetical protein [Pseudoalteromonas rhizosphaerae]
MNKNTHYTRNNFSIYEVTNKTGIELTLSELKKIEIAMLITPKALTTFINILHNPSNADKRQKDKFESIMKQYGFVNPTNFEATRTFLIRQARKTINLIGSMHLTPQKLYKCAGFGDATYYDRYGIIGFGKSFFDVGTDRKVDTIVHEFSHAVWTSEDTTYNARTAMQELSFIAQNARKNQTDKDRDTLLYSSYLFENAVRVAQ